MGEPINRILEAYSDTANWSTRGAGASALRAASIDAVKHDEGGALSLHATARGHKPLALTVTLGTDGQPKLDGMPLPLSAQRDLIASLTELKTAPGIELPARAVFLQVLRQNTGANYTHFTELSRVNRDGGTLVTSQNQQRVFIKGESYFAVTSTPGWGEKLLLRPLNAEEQRVLANKNITE